MPKKTPNKPTITKNYIELFLEGCANIIKETFDFLKTKKHKEKNLITKIEHGIHSF